MKIFTILFTLLVFSKAFSVGHFDTYKIYTAKGKEVDFSKVIKSVDGKTHVFFGEHHDNPIAHWLELELTQTLFQTYKKKLVLGAEMFEADNQYILDEYLKGQISAKNYQNEVRLWPNYNTDYKPLVEFAKANKLKFIATNIPRRYANMVYKKGITSLNDLSDLAKTYIAPLNSFEYDSTIMCYKELSKMNHGGSYLGLAQAIKDATMAYFILENTKPKHLFFHFNGSYHSDNYEGIVHYLKKLIAAEQILTISTVSQINIDELEQINYSLADFIICVNSNMTSTH
jgi:uncharacterized iron-regulated protein